MKKIGLALILCAPIVAMADVGDLVAYKCALTTSSVQVDVEILSTGTFMDSLLAKTEASTLGALKGQIAPPQSWNCALDGIGS